MSFVGAVASYSRILMTGGTGFVGGHLARDVALTWPHAQRVNLVRSGDGQEVPGWERASVSLFDGDGLSRLIERLKPDLVLHLAAQASVGASARATAETWRVNFVGSFKLAEACARSAAAATFLFASSAEVYGLSFLDGPASEDTPLRPANAYGRSKASAESMLGDVLRQDQRLIVVRPFNHTGPGQDERFVLPSFASQIAEIETGVKPRRLEVGNLRAEREFLDVGDVCRAYLSLLNAAPSFSSRETFNVSSELPFSLGELLERLRSMSTVAFEVAVDPGRLRVLDIPRATGLSRRLRQTTGWAPTTPIDVLLERLLESKRDAAKAKTSQAR